MFHSLKTIAVSNKKDTFHNHKDIPATQETVFCMEVVFPIY